MKSFYGFLFALWVVVKGAYAQSDNKRTLSILKNQFYTEFLKDKEKVNEYIKKHKVPARWTSGEKVFEIQKIDIQGKPVVAVTTSNAEAATTTGASAAWTGGSLGLNLNGQGIVIGEWDGGAVLRTHQELGTSRVTQVDGATSAIQHATHVAGTLIGNGTNASAKGMMHQGTLWAYDWNNDQSEMAAAASNGLRVSNHSYGWLTGWAFSNGSWYWYGNTSVSTTTDNQFGMYNSTAQQWDQIAFNAPNYLIVKAAGNDRGEGPSPGTSHFVWNGSSWVSSTATRDRDGGTSGYDCLGFSSVSKNVLTVGAVNRIPGGYTGSSSVVMSSFSCWGPTDDGRIKPDIVGAGVNLFSASTPNNNSYATLSGTSMASPNVAGSLGLIQQHAQNVRGSMLRGATLKGLAIHTAHEAGPNPGPDYMFGWGLMNVVGAINTINSVPANAGIFENVLSQGNSFQINVYNDGTQPLEATISWYDPAGPVNAANSFNDRSARLVNDLDLRIIRVSDGNTVFPWVLNPDAPAAAATRGDNVKDNVEKVSITNPVAGWYTIRVTHKGSLQGGSQAYSLIYTGASLSQECSQPTVGGTASGPGTLFEGVNGNFTLNGYNGTGIQWQMSTNGGNNWSNISGANSDNVQFNLPIGNYLIRAEVTRINCNPAYSNILTLQVSALPGNTISNPIVITTPYSASISTISGTGYTNNYTGPNNQASPDVFFRITTGPCSDSMTINTCGSNFDTYLHLLNASGGHIASLDDNGPLCTGTRASMKVAVSPNTTYFIVAEGYGSATGTINISVNEFDNPIFIPSVTAGGPTTFCEGGSVVLTASAGSSYLWNNGATTQSITVNSSGNYSVTVTNASGCSGMSQSVTVNVNANPLIFTLSGDGSYCSTSSGASATLSGSQLGVNYEFLFNVGNIIAVQAGTGEPLTVTNITGNGTLISRAITAAGCTLNMMGTVSVSPIQATVWYRDNDGDGFGNSNESTLACIQPNGYVNVAGDCDDANANVNPGKSEICGNDIDDNCNGETDEGCTAYIWYRDQDGDNYGNPNSTITTYSPIPPAGYISTAGDCDDNNAAVNPDAVEICNGIDDNCNGQIDENTPALATPGTIQGPAGVCRNTSGIVFSIDPIPGATSYIWTLPSGASGFSSTNTITLAFNNSFVTGNICVRAANACVQSGQTCRQILYYSTRPGTPAAITGATTVCPGSTHTYSIPPLANTTSYVWTPPANSTIIAGQGTTNVTIQFGANYTTASISVIGENCVGQSSSARTLSIARQAAPATPSTITGVATVCPGTTQIYSVIPVSGTTYHWIPPVNAVITSGQGTNTIELSFSGNYTSGTLSVNASNCAGTSAIRTLSISTTLASPSSITGNVTDVCGGNTFTYVAASVSGANTYNWTVPAGATIVSGQGTSQISVTFPSGFVSGNISVVAQNSCATSSARTITVRGLPAQPGTITGPVNNVCGGLYTYSIAAVTGATSYNWTVPSGWSIIQNNGTQIEVSVPSNFTSGTLRVTAVNNCGQSTARTLNVTGAPATPSVISGPTTVCSGQTGIVYSTAVVNGLNYVWTLPTGVSIVNGAGSPQITVNWGTSSGNVQVRTTNTCGSSGTRQLAVSLVACRFAVPNEDDVSNEIHIYPNPGNDVIYLSLTKPLENGALVQISDAQGKKLAELHLSPGYDGYPIPVQKLPSGLYLIKVLGEVEKSIKLIIRK